MASVSLSIFPVSLYSYDVVPSFGSVTDIRFPAVLYSAFEIPDSASVTLVHLPSVSYAAVTLFLLMFRLRLCFLLGFL